MPNVINIDLWFWRLDARAEDVVRWRSYLDAAEVARMERFVFAKDQTRYTICRSRMRRILGFYARTPPRDIAFATEGRDKPIFAGANPQRLTFNLTHTDGLACLAVTRGEPVGVDLERIRTVEDDFIAYALNPAEHTRLPDDPALRGPAFFRYWTAKEAYLKAIGTGLWQSLKTFDVEVPLDTAAGSFARCALPRIDDDAERWRNWHLLTFLATDQHPGAVAIAPPAGSTLAIRTRWIATPGDGNRNQ